MHHILYDFVFGFNVVAIFYSTKQNIFFNVIKSMYGSNKVPAYKTSKYRTKSYAFTEQNVLQHLKVFSLKGLRNKKQF